jgi:hypothetical protein
MVTVLKYPIFASQMNISLISFVFSVTVNPGTMWISIGQVYLHQDLDICDNLKTLKVKHIHQKYKKKENVSYVKDA